jgi:broad specificity phosphatase PhoE
MKLMLVRHGRTVENENRIVQGHLPGKLSKEGLEGVKKLAKELKAKRIDTIYSSDLKRAVDTAHEIAKYHPDVEIIMSKYIREKHYGEFQGKRIDDCWDCPAKRLRTDGPGGECWKDVGDRASHFLKDLRERHNGDNVMVVSHGGFLAVMRSLLEKKEHIEFVNRIMKNATMVEYNV